MAAQNTETRINASDPIDALPVLDKIHEDALRVMEEVGVRCVSPKVREYLENTGLAAYDETTGHIYILGALVEHRELPAASFRHRARQAGVAVAGEIEEGCRLAVLLTHEQHRHVG